jgi:hypothetical protein
VVPPRGQVMPRWRTAGLASLAAGALLVTLGLLLGSDASPYPVGPATVLRYGRGCLEAGVLTAVVPVALAALLVRGSLPVGRRWSAAALGAAGGSLGGLALEFHCPLGERFHLGLIHGGVVLASALIAVVVASVGRR